MCKPFLWRPGVPGWLIAVVFMLVQANGFASGPDNGTSRPIFEYGIFGTNVIKISPALYGPKVKGVTLAYETGLVNPYLSGYLAVRYFHGVDSLNARENSSGIIRHGRFEAQFRIYPRTAFNGFFVAPLGNVYHNGQMAGGLVLGYQFFITSFFAIEAFGGFQTTTEVEKDNFESPILPRLGINIGFAWTKKKASP